MKKLGIILSTVSALLLSAMSPAAVPSEAYDDNFETYLSSQQFPESYKPALRKLHEQHPAWVFTSLQTGLEWSKVMEEETLLGRSLIHNSSPDSWKSLEKGAYDLDNGTWYGFDGQWWVAASDETVAYYLDPRNFLDDTYIFMFENLSYRPGIHTREGVNAILKDTFMRGDYTCPDTGEVKNYIDTFMEAAELSGVSPYHLATSCRMEQGVNGSVQSLGTAKGYEGYFNFFDVQAYATATLTAGQNGARYAKTVNPTYLLPWTNQYKSILGGSIYLGSGYINKGQDGYYLQKFDVVDGGNGLFYHQYMTCISGAASLAASMKRAYSEELLASSLEFKIPVYKNMPAEASPRPGSKSNNNLLSSLTAAGHKLSPAFSTYTTEYTLEVPYEISSVTLYAKAYDENTRLSGFGQKKLSVGENELKVTATAEDGSERIYTVTVNRADAPDREKGDVNNDRKIDVVDALMILKHAAGNLILDKTQLAFADLNGDSIADIIDALMTLRMISGN